MGAKFVKFQKGSPIPIPPFTFKNGKSRPLISMDGLELVKHFESCALEAYADPVGVWTIGFGRIMHLDGRRVRPGDRCSMAQAFQWLFEDLKDDGAKYVAAFTKEPWLLKGHEWSALVSFTYNRGAGRFDEKLDDLVDEGLADGRFDQRELMQVANKLLEYDWAKKGGERKVLLGLKRRRYAEREMFIGGDWKKFAGANWLYHTTKTALSNFWTGRFA